MTDQFITLPRTGQAPLRFRGRAIAVSDGSATRSGQEVDRWHEITVYVTTGGQWVLSVSYRNRRGEPEVEIASIHPTARELAATLEKIDPTQYVVGFPLGENYREKQERLLRDIRSRFGVQVSEVLASSPEFAEEIE